LPGGTANQILSKIDSTDYNTQWVDAPIPPYTSTVKHQVKAGVAITKGQAVYVSSANGTNMIVSLASNASEATSSKTMGLLDATVAINGFANVVTEGLLTNVDTGSATAGDPVWLGTGGNLIFGLGSKPVAPAHLVYIGVVTKANSSTGEIFVRPQNGFELYELHNVQATAPNNGDTIKFDSSDSQWKTQPDVPTGSVQMFAGASAPTNWLLCDGSAISRTTYATLFALIGTTYGTGNGSTTFNVPDMRGRMPIGAGTGAGLTTRTLGNVGGAESVTVAASNLPTHSHTLSAHTHTSAAHSHTLSAHTHNANHGHTASSGYISSDHAHAIPRSAISAAGTNRLNVSASPTDLGLYTYGVSANHLHAITVDANNFNTGGPSTDATNSVTPGATGGPSSDTTGDGGFANTALGIMNPFLALNFIIRT
jgi:microcystin-dependent protein